MSKAERDPSSSLIRVVALLKRQPLGKGLPGIIAPELRSLAVSKLIDLPCPEFGAQTLLGQACQSGLKPWVIGLLNAGASPGAAGPHGDTPLHVLARSQNIDLASILLNAGANPHQVNALGQTPLDLAEGASAVRLLKVIERKLLPEDIISLQHLKVFDNPDIKGYLRVFLEKAKRLGVEVDLCNTNTLLYNNSSDIFVSGYFVESPSPKIGIAIDKEPNEWLQVLAHESSHMDQWSENSVFWKENIMEDGRESVDWIDDWIDGKDFPPEVLDRMFAAAYSVEMDCEKRTVDKIRSFNLPIDVEEYSQRANAYVHFYAQVRKSRKWNAPGEAPYQIEDVWRQADTKLSDVPGPALSAALERHWPSQTPEARPRPFQLR